MVTPAGQNPILHLFNKAADSVKTNAGSLANKVSNSKIGEFFKTAGSGIKGLVTSDKIVGGKDKPPAPGIGKPSDLRGAPRASTSSANINNAGKIVPEIKLTREQVQAENKAQANYQNAAVFKRGALDFQSDVSNIKSSFQNDTLRKLDATGKKLAETFEGLSKEAKDGMVTEKRILDEGQAELAREMAKRGIV